MRDSNSCVYDRCDCCPHYDGVHSACSRHPYVTILIDDPTVHSDRCPQELPVPSESVPEEVNRLGQFPGCYSGQVPYCEEVCRGCEADGEGSCCGCDRGVVRPRDGAFLCPYRDDEDSVRPSEDTGMHTTPRMAEIISDGINLHDWSGWQYSNLTGIYLHNGDTAGFSMRSSYTGGVYVTMDAPEAHAHVRLMVDHADTFGNVLHLYRRTQEGRLSAELSVPIVDGVAPRHTVPVQVPTIPEAVIEEPRQCSIMEWGA